ncbi:MAG: GIY-YIG nuclease family protein [Patescibacteria group bacterium]
MIMNNWKRCVYIIECYDGLYYTGLTWNVSERWEQHLSGLGSKYTRRHRPKRVVYIEEHNNFETARKREDQIKNWSQKKKRRLIEGHWGQYW